MDNVGVRTRSTKKKKELDLNMDTVPVQWLTVLPGFLEAYRATTLLVPAQGIHAFFVRIKI